MGMFGKSTISNFYWPAESSERLDQNEPLLPWPAFEAAIERSLRLLHGLHIPVSLIAVRPNQVWRGDVIGAIGDVLFQFGTVGRLSDVRVGLLYLGPHGLGGSDEVERYLRHRIGRRLSDRGWGALSNDLRMNFARGWTDEIDGVEDLTRLLLVDGGAAPARRRLA